VNRFAAEREAVFWEHATVAHASTGGAMIKRNIGKSFDMYPMPVVIVGTVIDDKPNFMTVAWATKLSADPPIVGISVGTKQHTTKGILQTEQFSVNFPSVDEVELADYCGLVHGWAENKAAHVDLFRGSLESAPMVRQCPINLECRLAQRVDLGKQHLFLGEVANVYASERILSDNRIDLDKFRPFVFTVPSNVYWALGERVGDAWSIGKKLLKQSDGRTTF
jgi:flavin reductase (DIM6/NTAB) family NADH-FMN oxidoreductase RutF